MINFDEEIKKFHPSLEIEEAEDAIYNNNISDITDVMIQMINSLIICIITDVMIQMINELKSEE